MQRFTAIVCILVSICMGCRGTVNINNMILRQNKYFFKSDIDHPYTGIAIAKYNDGTISNKISFLNGIPDGEWTAYGYEKEIIQTGFYKPIVVSDTTIASIGDIKRINLCNMIEGGLKFAQIHIISNQHPLIIMKGSQQYVKVLSELKSRGITFDSYPIDTMIMSNKEISL